MGLIFPERRFNKSSLLVVILAFFLVLLQAGTALAGVELTVSPRNVAVQAGETAIYTIEVRSITTEPETVKLYIKDMVEEFNYSIEGEEFVILPDGVVKTKLYVEIPVGQTEGEFSSKIAAKTKIIGYPDFVEEESYFTILTEVAKERPKVPLLTIPGLLVLFSALAVVALYRLRWRQ